VASSLDLQNNTRESRKPQDEISRQPAAGATTQSISETAVTPPIQAVSMLTAVAASYARIDYGVWGAAEQKTGLRNC